MIGVDVVADPRIPICRRREPFCLSLDPAYHHICKHCSDVPIFELWEKSILMTHLIKRCVYSSSLTSASFESIVRHDVLEPAEHVDWEAVPIVALSTAVVPT